MGESWDVNNFKQALVADKGQNYKPTFGAMRQSPTNERGVIADVKVVDVEKRRSKEHSGSKNYVRMNFVKFFAWFYCRLTPFHILYFLVIRKLICEREIPSCLLLCV